MLRGPLRFCTTRVEGHGTLKVCRNDKNSPSGSFLSPVISRLCLWEWPEFSKFTYPSLFLYRKPTFSVPNCLLPWCWWML
jgi:hypothetical protein